MKILVILNDLDIGGAQNYTISLMNQFVKLNHSISLRILSENIPLEERLNSDINLEIWPRKNKIDINILLKIRKEITENDYDGIIASYILYQKLATVLLKKKITTIYPIHFTTERNFKELIINYFTFRTKNKNEIYLTTIDNQTNYLCETYHLKKSFFNQILNGIDTEKFTITPTSFNKKQFLLENDILPKYKIILMVAGYREEKRHIDAINAFQLLRNKYSNIMLICVGDNRIKERNQLQDYLNKNNIQNIKLFLANEVGEIRKFYWCSDIFTLTSNKVETFPISVLEAMASGLPCVITNIGGANNLIINNLNGILCEANNVNDIKEKWEITLNNIDNYNKETIRNIVINNYSIITSSNEYINIFNNKKC